MFPPGPVALEERERFGGVERERTCRVGMGGAEPILSQGCVSMATVFDSLCQNYYFSAQTTGSG